MQLWKWKVLRMQKPWCVYMQWEWWVEHMRASYVCAFTVIRPSAPSTALIRVIGLLKLYVLVLHLTRVTGYFVVWIKPSSWKAICQLWIILCSEESRTVGQANYIISWEWIHLSKIHKSECNLLTWSSHSYMFLSIGEESAAAGRMSDQMNEWVN